jgi:hypothetical protein
MYYRQWKKKQLKKKRFLEAYLNLLEKDNARYFKFIFLELEHSSYSNVNIDKKISDLGKEMFGE